MVLKDVENKLDRIVDHLFSLIPAGVGSENAIGKLSKQDERRLLEDGARWAVSRGYGRQEDLSVMEEGGRLLSADSDLLSDRALERGLKQVGTLGSGNHFLEFGRVEEIYSPPQPPRSKSFLSSWLFSFIPAREAWVTSLRRLS